MNSSLKRNLLIGFAVSLLLLIISSAASYSSIKRLLDSQNWVNHTNIVINKLETIFSNLKDAETGQRGYLLTGEDEFLENYRGTLAREDKIIDDLQSLTRDNPDQQKDIYFLRKIITSRISHLQSSIDKKRLGQQPTSEDLHKGKLQMDQARELINSMENREQALLVDRTDRMKKLVKLTPKFIIGAAALAIIVTIFYFLRTKKDFDKRIEVQEELFKKDEEISKRLSIIRGIAETISSGDYKTRVNDEKQDILGNLAGSLNKMADSLDSSFENLSDNDWLQKGIAGLNEKMIGEKNIELLTYNIIEYLSDYINAPIGAFYLKKSENELALSAAVSIDKNKIKKYIDFGDGTAGQCAETRKKIYLQNIDKTDLLINYAAGSIKPTSIFCMPVLYESNLKGVVEFGFIDEAKPVAFNFLSMVCHNMGMAINSAQNHQRLQELLQETQAQAEELQAQHSEMENINTELEAQAEKLQASEEELKVQQEELQQANQELEERSRLLEDRNQMIMERNFEIEANAKELELNTKYKSEFLANMSHELRTPLNSILLLSRLLSDNHKSNLSKEEIEYAQVIESSGKGLLTLIDEILDLSKIEAGKMNLEFKEMKIPAVIAELKSLFEPVANDKKILFVVNSENDVPESIETDRLRLNQILRNLISNALKFTKEGSVTVNISVQNSIVSFAVKDTGIGIPKEKHQTIFEAFQQADGSTRRQFGGTGLGLSISLELAKLLGGEIILESDEDKGSTFKLSIPVNQTIAYQPVKKERYIQAPLPELMSETLASKQVLLPASIADDRDSISEGDKVILIVEDDILFAKSLISFTKQNNYKAIAAVNGDEGIALAKKYKPIGILLDIQLPGKNGWEVMTELKSSTLTKTIPVHIMSSNNVRSKSISAGAIDFIDKPLAVDKLGEVFKQIEDALTRFPKKVLIVEENAMHAQALAYFLETNNLKAEIKNTVEDSIKALEIADANCIVLNIEITGEKSYEILNTIKSKPGFENLPVIILTGKNLSGNEEMQIKKYADSIVVKTAHSYQRILDEVSLFLHLVEENKNSAKTKSYKKMGNLTEVLKGKTVLIADDDVRNIFSLTKSLEKYEMNIISAMDGKEAISKLNENKVDIILMDMMMPDMDGYESIEHIRKNIKYRTLPVIAITAKAMTGDRDKTINAGASDYITKPVDVDQLTSLLRVWLYQS